MSNPNHYWYEISRKMILRYPKYKDGPATRQEQIFKKAIETVLADTANGKNGAARVRAIDEIMFKKTKTYEGVAQELFYDWRTVQNWIILFINTVGKEAGY